MLVRRRLDATTRDLPSASKRLRSVGEGEPCKLRPPWPAACKTPAMTAPVPAANDVTVKEVLAYLDNEFSGFAAGVAEARYAVWLGSGISLSRVAGLEGILVTLLRRLQEQAAPADPSCRFIVALRRLLMVAGIRDPDTAGIDFSQPPEEWPGLADIVKMLARNYSRALDVRVEGEPADYLLWDVIDVRAVYGDGALEPDAEHYWIALLALEGHAPEVVSANWDGLIESAFRGVGHQAEHDVQVCVVADDLVGPTPKARLLKFHGCAVRAVADPAKYRELLIHQQSQIVAYRTNQSYTAIRNELVSVATRRPTLMIGLSAQDSDIQEVFAEAAHSRTWPYPNDPPAYVFGEDQLGVDQGTILRSVYGDAFTSSPTAIEDSAVIRAYAKPLLAATLLHVLCSKMQAVAARIVGMRLPADALETIQDGLRNLRDLAAARAGSGDIDFALALATAMRAWVVTARIGDAGDLGDPYVPALGLPLHQVRTDDALATGGMPEAALSLGLLGAGAALGEWEFATPAAQGEIKLRASGHRDTRVLHALSARAAIQMELCGAVGADAGDVVIVHSDSVAKPMTRSPRAAPGRTGARRPRNVDVGRIAREADSLDELTRRYREEAGI